jgi:hypothetical protein
MKAGRGLGELMGVYRKSWALPVVFLLLFGFPAWLVIASWWESREWPVLLFGLALFLPAVVTALDRWKYRVYLHDKGLVVDGLFGRSGVRFAAGMRIWQKSVRESINGIPAGTHRTIRIWDGKRTVKLGSSIVGIVEIGEMLSEFELNGLRPAMAKRYEQGERVEFGPMALQGGKLFNGRKNIPVTDVGAMELANGHLTIRRHGGRRFARHAFGDIPNAMSFISFVEALTGSRAELEGA